VSEQPSPGVEASLQYWKNLAEQRGFLLHDMTDKWAERRVEFVKAKRAMGEKLFAQRVRERILTLRIVEVERTLLIVESRITGLYWEIMEVLHPLRSVSMRCNEPPRGGDAGAQQE
jgi:hypothetical protein